MSAIVVDLVEAWVGEFAERAARERLILDEGFMTAYPTLCPICGQDPRFRQPYPGVQLVTYHDALRQRVVPFWACAPCAKDLQAEPERMVIRVRARLGEWMV